MVSCKYFQNYLSRQNFSVSNIFFYDHYSKLFKHLTKVTWSKISTPIQPRGVHCVRGQSGFFNLAQTEGNMQIKFDLKLSVYSLGVDIWLLSFKFNSGLIGWPPQPPRERVPKINKIVGFWWSIPNLETRVGHFGAMVDGNINLHA